MDQSNHGDLFRIVRIGTIQSLEPLRQMARERSVEQYEILECFSVPVGHRDGKLVAAFGVSRSPRKHTQFGRCIERATRSVKCIDKAHVGLFIERETKGTESANERGGRRSGKQRVLSVPQTPAVGQPNRPLPNLFKRLVAGIDQNVLVNRPRNLPLCEAQQSPVEESTAIGDTVKDLKTAFLGHGFKYETPTIYLNCDRPGGMVPAEFLEEQFREMMVGQVSGQWVHSH